MTTMTDPYWYKDAIVYELRVRSFFDSDDDGVGDLRGLAQKLDYLQDLGVTTLWLLPFYPSPLRDDGYDIADYEDVHPAVGTLHDFRHLLAEAHARGLRVVTELVLNHTSDLHAWFQRARLAAAGSRWRNWSVWSETPERYLEARVIFTDYEVSNWTWDPVAKAYYWHRFFSHQPDLNFDNPEVRKAMLRVVDFWLKLGVDGLRLDAVPYLFEREGTSCENLAETHAFLRELRRHVDRHYGDRMLLAEANQWPEDAVAYFGAGDECHVAFHFPIMPRLYMALYTEDAHPILDILEQTPALPEPCQWATFLRNHDELTLEMVTDEERDTMVRAYASDPQARVNLGIRRRLAPLLRNSRRRIELMNGLLFALPGTPVVYYGDEIGMGDNIYLGDRNSVRTPMHWSSDRNAGFSRANAQQLILPPIVDAEYHYEAVNVDTQQRNPSSLLWWMKRIIALRKKHAAFGRGSFEPLAPRNRRVLAFVRRHEGETLLVVANLSRFAQPVELDLGAYVGYRPVEMFGKVRFPLVDAGGYRLSLPAHGFYWFKLERPWQRRTVAPSEPGPLALVETRGKWADVLGEHDPGREVLEQALGAHLATRRWCRGKGRELKGVRVADSFALEEGDGGRRLLVVDAEYVEGSSERYSLVLGLSDGPGGQPVAQVRVRTKGPQPGGLLRELGDEAETGQLLLDVVRRHKRMRGGSYLLAADATPTLRSMARELQAARSLGGDQSNTCYALGDRVVCKLMRGIEDGPSVELEILGHLAARASQTPVPRVLGQLYLQRRTGAQCTLALFEELIANQGDGWRFVVGEIQRYFERVLVSGRQVAAVAAPGGDLLDLVDHQPPPALAGLLAGCPERAHALGRLTAELHVALGAPSENASFGVEKISSLARRALYQAARNLGARSFSLLREHLAMLPEETRALGEELLRREPEVGRRLRARLDHSQCGKHIRVHGDFHLGQVLRTADGFAIIDFEGEPARALADRRRKRSPLADVAGMLRSYHYAVHGVLGGDVPGSDIRPADRERLEPWARAWYAWVGSRFVAGYLEVGAVRELLPTASSDLGALLELHLLEKALYELGYELNNRPDWVAVPIRGILDLLGAGPST
jgi:maltose alpha-D-glucosyltransferase / alpha-amylase